MDIDKVTRGVLTVVGWSLFLIGGWMLVGFFVGISIRAARWVIGL